MLFLLRNIRRKLMQKNKLTTYLLYAIGEIFLVVIGIMIAVSLNNWNEKIKNEEKEKNYYERILKDLEIDRKNLLARQELAKEKIEVGKQLLLDLDSQSKDLAYLAEKYIYTYRWLSFVPVKSAILDITSSGHTNLLEDTIKTLVLPYYSQLDVYTDILKKNADIALNFLTNNDIIELGLHNDHSIRQKIGQEVFSTFRQNPWHLDSSTTLYKKFQSDILFFTLTHDRQHEIYQLILEEMEPVMKALEKSLSEQ